MLTWVTDGGLETDLLFHRGMDLPEFAAFPLVTSHPEVLRAYYADYAAIAVRAGAGVLLETPTWRANPDWAGKLGYDRVRLREANLAAVDLMRRVAGEAPGGLSTRISGVVGPRGDGYVASGAIAEEAADYHAAQIGAFAESAVDVIHAMTLTEPAEAIGVVRAARAVGLAVGVSFTVETDGRLPDGTPLPDAIAQVDAAARPDWYGVNCAHPTHVLSAVDGGSWQERITMFRPNASTLTHEELDAMEVLDEGDRALLGSSTAALLAALASVTTLGGCCGTDASHVAALWGQPVES